MLIVMAGLPGSGKSAVAGGIATALRCGLLSVDPIEAALWRAGIHRDQPTGLAAYVVAEDLAAEQLRLGNDVVVDAVNDLDIARRQWHDLSARTAAPLAFVEVACSDEDEHRRRLQARQRDIVGFPEPTWESVVHRRSGLDDWDDDRVRVDTMQALEHCVVRALEFVERTRRQGA